jgi:uncharacterized protein
MYTRKLDLPKLLNKKSFFLFGPRATGKSTLIDAQLPDAQVFDLLSTDTYGQFIRRPGSLEELITDTKKIVVIDEIQKIPSLLDEVHRLIQKSKIKFLLTGSSARKLKHGGANLLAGRAWESRLLPLTWSEITDFDLLKYLNRGGIPDIYLSEDYDEELKSYVNLYLQEEIKAEAVTRNVQAFAQFLDAVAVANGNEINYEGFSSDLQVSPSTLKNYLQILEDTLIGFLVPGYTKTKKRKAISRSKHYMFDVGVSRTLSGTGEIKYKSKAFGDAFEHFIVLELRAFISYSRKNTEMKYWRSTSKFEVDLILGDEVALEIKSTESVNSKHLRGLRAFKEENIAKQYIVVSLDAARRKTSDDIQILPWRDFLKALWAGKLI